MRAYAILQGFHQDVGKVLSGPAAAPAAGHNEQHDRALTCGRLDYLRACGWDVGRLDYMLRCVMSWRTSGHSFAVPFVYSTHVDMTYILSFVLLNTYSPPPARLLCLFF